MAECQAGTLIEFLCGALLLLVAMGSFDCCSAAESGAEISNHTQQVMSKV
jgi:hypothetical protein